MCVIYGLEEKNSKSEVIFAVCRLPFTSCLTFTQSLFSLTTSNKGACYLSVDLNIHKYFKNFKLFLPWERTLQSTDHRHLWPIFGKNSPRLPNIDQTNMSDCPSFVFVAFGPHEWTAFPHDFCVAYTKCIAAPCYDLIYLFICLRESRACHVF